MRDTSFNLLIGGSEALATTKIEVVISDTAIQTTATITLQLDSDGEPVESTPTSPITLAPTDDDNPQRTTEFTLTAVSVANTTMTIIVTDDMENRDEVTIYVTVQFVTVRDVCERTQQVQDRITSLTGNSDCGEVSRADLESITALNIILRSISSLSEGDFSGLSDLQQLYLGSNDISTLPVGIFSGLSNLQQLWLNRNEISTLPSDIFSGLSNLQELRLNNNEISTLPAGIFSGLSSLEELYLEGNDLSMLPVGIFSGLSNLQELDLEGNDLSMLPVRVFSGLSNLQELDLERNKISALPVGIFNGLSNLQRLDLSGNGISTLSVDIFSGLSNLQEVRLNNNEISTLPAGIFSGLSNLQRLALERNKISALPVGIFSGLSNLQRLFLNDNKLGHNYCNALEEQLSISDFSCGGSTLRITSPMRDTSFNLLIGGSEASATTQIEVVISDTAIQTTATITLQLDSDGEPVESTPTSPITLAPTDDDNTQRTTEFILTAVSAANTTMTIIVTDDMENRDEVTIYVTVQFATVRDVCERTQQVRDAITSLTGNSDCGEVSRAALESITVMNISQAGINSVSEGDFSGLSNLQDLDLGDNDLSTLPSGIFSGLSNLRFLRLDYNGISMLPAGIFSELSSLEELYLEGNDLSMLPVRVFSRLSNLEVLDLKENSLSTLPAGIFSGLSSLEELYLDGNKLSMLPVGIFSRLSNLQYLYLHDNDLSMLPAGIFSGLSSLEELYLDGNGLSMLRMGVFSELSSLQELDLNSNDLSALPMGVFSGLSNLQYLDLNSNDLSALPMGIFSGLSSLEELDLDDNKLGHNYCNALEERLSISSFSCGGSTLQIISPMRDTSFNLLIGGSEASATTQIEVVISDTAIQTTATITLQLDSDGEPVESTPTSPITLAPTDDGNTQRTTEFTLTAVSAANTTMTIIVTDDMENRDEVTIYVTVQFATVRDVCDRTQQVRDAITSLTNNSDCGEVSRAALESIIVMDISEAGINSVLEGDFSGLSNLEVLDLGDNDLSTPTVSIFSGLSNLRFLRLDYNGISMLPAGIFSGLSSLEELYLEGNDLSMLPVRVFSRLSNLEVLDLKENSLSTLPAGIFSRLSSLEELYLDGNDLSMLPVGVFSGLSNLQYLYLHDNNLSTLSAGIFSGLSSLEELYLDGNGLSMLRMGVFSELSSLQELYLNSNDLSALPMGVFSGLSNLQYLDLNSNGLSMLRMGVFSELSSLEELDLDDNKLGHNYCNALEEQLSISSFSCGGSTLRITSPMRDTSFNLLIGGSEALATTKIEVVISDTAIQTTATITLQLDSDGEPVESTPTSPITLAPADDDNTQRTTEFTLTAVSAANTTMTIIVMDDMENRDEVAIYVTVQFVTVRDVCERTQQVRDAITSLTGNSDCGEVSRAALESITAMDISEAEINSVLEGDFSGLSNLEVLDLGDNDLSTPTVSIFSGLSNLRFLRLDYNGISMLPAGIFSGLSSLEELYLEGNDLSMLPVRVFSRLSNLEVLDLKENSLSTLPAGIFSGLSSLEELYLDGNDLSMLPVGVFSGLSNLQYLYLHDNDLSMLPAGIFSGLSSLEELYLDGNGLSMLRMGVFSELSSLQELYLNSNDLSALPMGVFSGLSNLQYLDLNSNDLSTLPMGIFSGLSKLQELDLNDNKLGHNYCNALEEQLSISDFSCGGSTLQIISPMRDTSFNLLIGGSEALATTQIEVVISDTAIQTTATITLQLDSDGEPVESTPTSPITLAPTDDDNTQRTTEFTLTAVSVANTTMTIIVTDDMENRDEVAIYVTVQFVTVRDVCERTQQVRDAITSLTGNSDCGEVSRADLESIIVMDISEAGINSVSEGDFSGLSNLQDLDLGDNDLSTPTVSIFSGLSNLRFLRLDYSGISTLPSGIFNRLSNLEELYLEGNNLSMLPVRVFSGLSNLQYLDLKENSLSTLPAGIFSGLSSLEELYLDGNKLSTLPVDIFSRLSNLQYLYLHDNDLSTLPAGIFSGLSSLEELYLDGNGLSMLRMGVFSELSSLQELYLNSNDLSALPMGVFSGLSNLQYLDLNSNDLSALPMGIFSGLSKLQELDLDDNKLGHNYCNALEEQLSISDFSCGGSTLQISSPMRDTSFNLLIGGSEALATTKIEVVISDTAIQTTATITLQLDSDGEPVESTPTSPITLAPADDDNTQRTTEFTLTAVSVANTTMTIIVTDDMENRDEVTIYVTVQFVTVRSDVRDAIMQRHPQSTTMQTVLLEGAQALQNALWAGSVSHTATALETSEVFDHALDCVEDEDEAFFILTSAIDTFDRLRDYVRYNELLHGQVFTDSQRPTPCPGEGQAAPRGFRTPSLAPPVRVTEVFFINGIFNDKTKAEKHVEKIAEAYASYKKLGYRFTLLYNSNMGSDILEFLKQKIREEDPSLNEEKLVRRILKWMSGDDEEMDPEISAEAIAKSQDKLDSAQTLLEREVKASLKEGNRVVLIAHSQGNLFANGILQSISDKYQESIGMIGIASTVSTNTVLINSVYGKGYPYVTLTDDKVINNLRGKFTVLPANTSNTSSILNNLKGNHSFQKAYFKDGLKSREKIDEHMKAYMKGLKYPEVSMAGVFVEVCDRTWQVRDAITALTGNSDCGEVSRADLESIMTTTMTIAYVGISSLSEGDFSGLSNLQELYLSDNEISILPVGIFSGLSNLQRLSLYSNQISTLPAGIFSGLSNLQKLFLGGNQLGSDYCDPLRTQLSIEEENFACD